MEKDLQFYKSGTIDYLQLFHDGNVTKSIFDHSHAQNRCGNKCNCTMCKNFIYTPQNLKEHQHSLSKPKWD